MLPFRRTDRVVALDDTDIVESRDLAQARVVFEDEWEMELEMELDLGDAIEVKNGPHAFLQPDTRLFRLTEEPRVERPLTLKTPTQSIRPALVTAHLQQQQEKPFADDDDEEEELTEVQPPSVRARSASQITPSPFVRTFQPSQASQDRHGSLAPMAISTSSSTFPGATFTDSPAARLRFEHEERMESALARRELDEITGGRSTNVLRALALVLMGGVAAASVTAYVLRDDVAQHSATSSETMAPPPMASIMVPKDAVLIGDTPPQQVQTRPGSVAQPREAPTATEVKFGDSDTLLVSPPAPASVTSATATSAGSLPITASGPSHSASTPSVGASRGRKPSRPLPPNALLPDSEPPSYSLPPSRGGAPKDPIAEAQLRASMR